MTTKLNVVVVGAGGAGVLVAQTLDKKLNPALHTLTLVTARDYYMHLPAALRMLVSPEGNLFKDAVLPLDNVFGTGNGTGRVGKIIYDKVERVEENAEGKGGQIVLRSGAKIAWDVLVITTGSKWPGALNLPDGKAELSQWVDEWNRKFAQAKSVLLVGAGAVGLELAGELRDSYPQTPVTIVQLDQKALNPMYHDKYRDRVVNDVEKRGVKVILGDSIDGFSPATLTDTPKVTQQTIQTKKGISLDIDLVVPTFGPVGVETSFLKTSSSPTISSSVLPNSHLSVLSTLQLKSNPRVFAAGDVIEWNEQHMLVKASQHAPIVAANVLAVLDVLKNGREVLDVATVGNLKHYKGFMEVILLTNGRNGGSLYLTIFGFPIILGNWIASIFKSRTLLVSMAKAAVGYRG